jgi:MoaA/NifB/PqqE/SkfB family radical SAM enzyme
MKSMQKWFKPRARRPFKLFQIEPTLLCSLACVMCPWSELRQSGSQMEWGTFSRIQAHLRLAEAVDFTGGGEPLLHPRLPEMVRAAKEAGCRTGFSTNGVRLTAELAQALLAAGLDWISFSVDAATAELYERIRQGANFEQVIGNIARLSELKSRLGSRTPEIMMVFVMMSGDPDNVHELPDFVRLAHRLGAEQVIAKNLDVILKANDDRRRVFTHAGAPNPAVEASIRAAQKQACESGVRLRLYALQPEEQVVCEHDPLKSVFFNWEGMISPCITLAYAEDRIFAGEPVHTPCQRFGCINMESFQTIWDGTQYRDFRRHFELRRRCEKQALIDTLLQGSSAEPPALPLAPEGCRTCYYLYGI